MKRIATLLTGFAIALSMDAQSNFLVQFADKNGNIIADGTTLDITNYETSDFGDVMMPSGLYAKNTTSEAIRVKGKYTIISMENGRFQTCFPTNCMSQKAAGSYETQEGQLTPLELKDMQTEWIPTGEGVCQVTYQLCYYAMNDFGRESLQNGPILTLNMTYGQSAGIAHATPQSAIRSVDYYDLAGRHIEKPQSGVYVMKTVYANGATAVAKYQTR